MHFGGNLVDMAGDVDRKKLWGRSGSRCAMCDLELTQVGDVDTIVGDEAHIRSKTPNGPRYDPDYPSDKVDTYEIRFSSRELSYRPSRKRSVMWSC